MFLAGPGGSLVDGIATILVASAGLDLRDHRSPYLVQLGPASSPHVADATTIRCILRAAA